MKPQYIEPPSIDVNTNTYEVEIAEGSVTPVDFYFYAEDLREDEENE